MIKKRKRNPKHNNGRYIELLAIALYQKDPEYLSLAIAYYNMRNICKDCGGEFQECKCEYCDECGFNQCLCKYDLNISMTSPYTDRETEIKTEKAIWEIARKTLTDEQFQKLERKVILRKNPQSKHVDTIYQDLLYETILRGDPYYLADSILYYNIGDHCTDCDSPYYNCKCEWCDECRYPECLCDLNITPGRRHQLKDNHEKIVKRAWKLAEETLTQEQFKKLKRDIND